ncbi:MAG: glycoside hydrolase family 130 protein [Bacteroidales bacterium]|jgi:predicted GH43/DUF377 family glycosyl hydrolase|nr:glycoside hydrolase family 130 protein [Bacteroidales bacterium]
MQVAVKRSDIKFTPDFTRVIARYTDYSINTNLRIIENVLKMSDAEVDKALKQVLRDYTKRHRNISSVFERNYSKVVHLNNDLKDINEDRKLLIGSYVTMEYAIESAAFFNPSIVEHPDQSELQPGEKRIIMSFRATGEGHISSIVFRSGIIDKHNKLSFRDRGRFLDNAEKVVQHTYDKKAFQSKLEEMKFFDRTLAPNIILDQLPDNFTYEQLENVIAHARKSHKFSETKTLTLEQIMWLASSHYEIEFSKDTSLSERVIFPLSETEKAGIEDARFVRFVDEDGSIRYFATYTAYDGHVIMPKLIETEEFYNFKVYPIQGEIAVNKGMALFPRKIKGRYAMLGRIDGYSNYLSFSDDYKKWDNAVKIQEPKYPWEFIKIGNCGSPLETEEGWLVITHAVGQMKEYALGASLFDLDDPTREIGRLSSPLMIPDTEEREGYVPNVLYSCGSMINNNDLIVPYGISDYASTFACVNLNDLLTELKRS